MMRERLVVHVPSPSGEDLKRTFPPSVRVGLGRDAGCHVVLPDASVSRHHATVSLGAEGIWVTDTSANGTLLEGEVVRGTSRLLHTTHLQLVVGTYRVLIERRSFRPDDASKRRLVQKALLERLNLRNRRINAEVSDELRHEVISSLEEIVRDPKLALSATERIRLVRELTDEALGLGPLEALLKDPAVSEIMVVDQHTIYAERSGTLELTGRTFTDADAVRAVIERIVTPLGRRVDESSPLVDARLADGSRVNAVIPPLALRGPCITIRKFPERRLTMDQLLQFGALDRAMGRFLERSVRLKKNIVISGGTGSGKTTLLNVLSAFIDERERVVTIEDAAELSLVQPHVVGLESKPANLEGRGAVTIRDLLKNALRMRPDRIVVGECRGGEAIDMLQAMNTGHEGSMTTTHANSPEEAVARLETLCLMAGLALPLSAIRRQIASSIHLIVQQSRLSDGRRLITRIGEVARVDETGEVELRELFRWSEHGGHELTGNLPSFLEELCLRFGSEEAFG